MNDGTTALEATDEAQSAADASQNAPAAQQPQQPIATEPSPQSTQTIAPPDQPNAPIAAAAAAPPVQRHGIAGILDSVADMLSSPRGPSTVSIDSQGNRTTSPGAPISRGRQWANIGLEALQGATTAAAAPPGPGHTAQGVAAAVGQAVQQKQQQGKDQQEQADKSFAQQQQAKMNNINYQILSRKMVADTITQKQQGVKANQEQVDFSNRQLDREKGLGSYDLGFVDDVGKIADLGNKTPDFISKLHAGIIIPVPIYDADGKTLGVQVFQRKPDTNSQPTPDDMQIHMFTPGEKPGDPPKYTMYTPTNMTIGQATTADMKAANDYNAWQTAQQKIADDKAGVKLKGAQTAEAYAKAGESNANASQARSLTAAGGYVPGRNPVLDDTADGLASGRYLEKDLPKRTGKGQPTPQEQNMAANAVSMQKYGLPFSPTIIEQENKFAAAPKTQAYLEGIDRMTGAHGDTGQLQQVLDLAQKAGVGSNAPMNEVKLAIKSRLGNTAAKNFNTLLSETQSNLGTLIGNPLLGSGESDKKLQTAKDAFGSNPTMDNLKGAVATVNDVLNRSRQNMAANNRYIQQRYGTRLSPQQAAPKAAPPPPAGATAEVKNAQGVVTGHVVNGGYVALAVQ